MQRREWACSRLSCKQNADTRTLSPPFVNVSDVEPLLLSAVRAKWRNSWSNSQEILWRAYVKGASLLLNITEFGTVDKSCSKNRHCINLHCFHEAAYTLCFVLRQQYAVSGSSIIWSDPSVGSCGQYHHFIPDSIFSGLSNPLFLRTLNVAGLCTVCLEDICLKILNV